MPHIQNRTKNYSELKTLKTFKERYEYLRLTGVVGKDTFGHERYLNQSFYTSPEWRSVRNAIILRDNGCDLGLEGYELYGRIYIHHMNPITPTDILSHSDYLMNPEYLVCVSQATHNAIHYGDISTTPEEPTIRTPGDTCPWKR